MPNWDIRIKVTKAQKEKLNMDAQAQGFATIASYMRFLCFEQKNHIATKVIENNEILKELRQKLMKDSPSRLQ